MTRSFKTVLVILALIALLAPAFAQDSSAKPVTLKLYVQYSNSEHKLIVDSAIAETKKVYPNVDFEIVIMPNDNAQKLKLMAATGDLPDLFQIELREIEVLKQSNSILVLDNYPSTAEYRKYLMPSTLGLMVNPTDNHVYAYPFNGNDLALIYYNKALFAKYNVKVPTTFSEMIAAAKVFRANGIIPFSVPSKEMWFNISLFDLFLTRLDPKGIISIDSGEANPSNPIYKTVAQGIIDMAKAGMFSESVITTDYDQGLALFHQGKAAMFINGEWQITDSYKILGDNLDYMYPPAPDAATYAKAKYNFSGGGAVGGYAVSANTPNKELAVKVAALLSRKHAEYRYMKVNPFVAIDMKNAKPDVPFVTTMQRLLNDIPKIQNVTIFSWGMKNPKMALGLGEICQQLIAGNYTSSDKFVQDLDKAMKSAK